MTSLEAITLDLPDGMRSIEGDPSPMAGTDPGGATRAVREERRWMSDDAFYVVVTVSPPAKGPEVDPLALDLAVGATIERYRVHFAGTVDSMTELDIGGAIAGRGARLHLESATGEALELMLVAALAADRDVVVVQATWPAAMAERYAERARRLGRSLTLPSAAG